MLTWANTIRKNTISCCIQLEKTKTTIHYRGKEAIYIKRFAMTIVNFTVFATKGVLTAIEWANKTNLSSFSPALNRPFAVSLYHIYEMKWTLRCLSIHHKDLFSVAWVFNFFLFMFCGPLHTINLWFIAPQCDQGWSFDDITHIDDKHGFDIIQLICKCYITLAFRNCHFWAWWFLQSKYLLLRCN